MSTVDADDLKDLFGEDSSSEEEIPNQEEEASSLLQITLPNIEQVEKSDQLFLLKLPNFLHVDPTPFDPLTWTPPSPDSASIPHIQNTLRWKYDTQNSMKRSNARLVRWDDGSLSMLIGQESFEVSVKNIPVDQHQYLVAHHPSQGLLHTQARFTHNMTFRPSSMHSATHQRIAKGFKVHKREVKTKAYTPATHPELDLIEVERTENEKLKARRRLEAKRRSAAGKFGHGLSEEGLEYDSDDEELGRGVGRKYERYDGEEGMVDEDDDDIADFVVDDEDERAEKIKKAKRNDSDDDNDDDRSNKKARIEESEEEAEMSEEEQMVMKKTSNKKRVIESDSEDHE